MENDGNIVELYAFFTSSDSTTISRNYYFKLLNCQEKLFRCVFLFSKIFFLISMLVPLSTYALQVLEIVSFKQFIFIQINILWSFPNLFQICLKYILIKTVSMLLIVIIKFRNCFAEQWTSIQVLYVLADRLVNCRVPSL